MPGLDFFITEDEGIEVYPARGTFDEMRNKTFVILHTSGSTGFPKPVYVTHGTFACNDAHQLIPSLGGNPTTVHYIRGKRLFLAFPLFHAANLTFTIGFNVYSGVTCVLPPPGPLTVEVVDMIHTYGNLDGSLLPPSTIIEIYKNPEYLSNLIRLLQFVAYVGGTLSKDIGDFISSRMKLITLMGSTETMLLPIELNANHADWEYLPISDFLGHEFQLSRDGLRELVIIRNQELDLFQGVFSTFPDINEYHMSDLYDRHPTKPGSWIFRARADDIIAFSNAEKLNPVTMESVISAHPLVNSAVIGGHGEFQSGLLIEPKVSPTTIQEKEQLLHEIWPIVVQANRDCPAHGRIMKNFVIFTTPEKPMPRAGKDTVQRHAALKLYAEEFKALYTSCPTPAQPCNKVPNNKPKPSNNAPQSSSPTVLVGGSVPFDKTGKPSDEYHTLGSSASSPAMTHVVSDLDAHIEATLRRTLPIVLPQHLGPALVQLLGNLLPHMAVQANQANGTHDAEGFHRAFGMQAPKDSLQAKRAGKEAHQSGDTVNHVPFKVMIRSHNNTSEDLRVSIYRAISTSTYLQDLEDSADLFEYGLDSLQVPVLVDEINAFLTTSRPDLSLISTKTIYANPSVGKLLEALESSSSDMKRSNITTVNGFQQIIS